MARVLEKNQIDYLLFTAGKFKRTVTALSAVSEEASEKFQEELEVRACAANECAVSECAVVSGRVRAQ